MIVAFSGHRPNKLFGYDITDKRYNRIRDAIKECLIELEVNKTISGMALGIDTIAAEISIELRIPFIAAVPFIGQESAWPKQSQEHYKRIIAKADETVIVSPGGYAAWKMQTRNEWMVDNCDTLIAVWDGTLGGTGNCVDYATKIGKQMLRIDPRVGS